MDNKLLVTPEELNTAANGFEGQATQVKALHDEMLKKVDGLSSVWTGTAGENYRKKFKALQKAMDTIFRMIKEHVDDLKEMAEQYQGAETDVDNITNELPTSDL